MKQKQQKHQCHCIQYVYIRIGLHYCSILWYFLNHWCPFAMSCLLSRCIYYSLTYFQYRRKVVRPHTASSYKGGAKKYSEIKLSTCL